MSESEECPRCKQVIHEKRHVYGKDLQTWFDHAGLPKMGYNVSTGIYTCPACFTKYKKQEDERLERI